MSSNKCTICGELGNPVDLNGIEMYKCVGCGLVWQRDFMPLGDFYEKLRIDLSENKIKRRTRNYKGRVQILEKYFKPNNYCDIGCGDGLVLKILSEKGYKNLHGIDPNERSIAFAQKNGLEAQCGEVTDFPVIAQQFRINNASMFHVIEHLKDPFGSVQAIFNSLPPGGFFVVETPDLESYAIRKSNYIHPLVYPEHLFMFNWNNLSLLLEKAGFRIVAKGHRDFDQNHLGPQEILFRLGWNTKNKPILGLTRFFSPVLSRLVALTGRLDFVWVIGRKPGR